MLLATLLAGGCSWVDLDEEAQQVGVIRTEDEASGCRKVGEVGARTTPKVAGIARDETTVAVELERLARNDAARMGANTILPLGPVTLEGTRRYAAYACPLD
jgi:hypothetical protein